ncbi:hypothetical protein CEXT_171521 [Caerostris extrusa]|uniref:Uncharacterized protein n=1 Tax=Caerostris extrusa TaxID=172846 RepID=A0AAV4QZQ3_CAEEX|nr:hypothetical protein CEXT_171521 [Caerostris extrusa]
MAWDGSPLMKWTAFIWVNKWFGLIGFVTESYKLSERTRLTVNRFIDLGQIAIDEMDDIHLEQTTSPSLDLYRMA